MYRMLRRQQASRSGNLYVGVAALVLVVLLIYYLPGIFRQSAGSDWKPYPREWVFVEDVSRPPNTFTFVTYNILCQGTMLNSKKKTKYGDCGEHFYDLNLRQSRLMKEVETMDPDVLCVQEIDWKWYDSFWRDSMSGRGYDSVVGVTKLRNEHNVGQAIFWKKGKFRKNFSDWYHFHDLLREHAEKAMSENELNEFMDFYTRRNLLLIAELQEVTSSGSKVLIGCPHHSHRQTIEPTIQIWQAGVGLQKMQQISQERATPAVIYSGDLNTPTNHPAYDFLRTGKLTPELRKRVKDMENWEGMAELADGEKMKKYMLSVMDLVPSAFHHELKLTSAYPVIMSREPHWTMLESPRRKVADYIWVTAATLGVVGVLREPEQMELMTPEAHCSLRFASNHVLQAAKLAPRRSASANGPELR